MVDQPGDRGERVCRALALGGDVVDGRLDDPDRGGELARLGGQVVQIVADRRLKRGLRLAERRQRTVDLARRAGGGLLDARLERSQRGRRFARVGAVLLLHAHHIALEPLVHGLHGRVDPDLHRAGLVRQRVHVLRQRRRRRCRLVPHPVHHLAEEPHFRHQMRNHRRVLPAPTPPSPRAPHPGSATLQRPHTRLGSLCTRLCRLCTRLCICGNLCNLRHGCLERSNLSAQPGDLPDDRVDGRDVGADLGRSHVVVLGQTLDLGPDRPCNLPVLCCLQRNQPDLRVRIADVGGNAVQRLPDVGHLVSQTGPERIHFGRKRAVCLRNGRDLRRRLVVQPERTLVGSSNVCLDTVEPRGLPRKMASDLGPRVRRLGTQCVELFLHHACRLCQRIPHSLNLPLHVLERLLRLVL